MVGMAQRGVKVVFDSEELRRMYVDRQLTQKQIAETLGVSTASVVLYLRKNGIAARPARRAIKQISREDLQQMYVEKGMSLDQIAKARGVSVPTVTARLRENGIAVRSPILKIEFNPDDLRRLYIDEGLTQEEIAELWGVHQVSVGDWLRQCGIKARPGGAKQRVILPEDELKRLYVDEKMNAHDLRKHFGCGMGTVTLNLKKYGLLRSREEQMAIRSEKAATNNRAPFLSGERQYAVVAHQGYRMVRESEGVYVGEHRLVAEKALGRQLSPDEQVHHINFDRRDNRVENLAVLSASNHRALHAYLGRCQAYNSPIGLGGGGMRPEPIDFGEPVFWGGVYINGLDLIGDQESDTNESAETIN